MIELKGLTWDHPRGFDSIVAATSLFEQSYPDIRITWCKRTLKEFGDQPLDQFINENDLLMIDHPFVGEAHKNGLLSKLEPLMSAHFLAEQAKMHVGKSFESYTYQNHQYALPIDASAQFSAFHADVFLEKDIPRKWDQFLEMLSQYSFSKKVIWPLCPTDLWCSFLTLSAQIAGVKKKVFNENGLEQDIAQKAIEFLKNASENIPRVNWKLNPIQALELMTKGNYAFSPILFGYISYSKNRSPIRFANSIAYNPDQPISLLGGVGLAISACSSHQRECAEFLKFVLRDEILSGCYFENSGQPSNLSSWQSTGLNKQSENFFANTMETMKHAYVRPRVSGFNQFQETASHFLHKNLRKMSEFQLTKKMNHMFTKYCF
ncbi:MAG: carbohydrate ABC transporter substrate-binding protein [Reichenbachiella sp.]